MILVRTSKPQLGPTETRVSQVLIIAVTISVAAAAAKSLQSCPTLCDPIDGSPPGSPVPGILQARTLEWVLSAIYLYQRSKVNVIITLQIRKLKLREIKKFNAIKVNWWH